MTSLHPRACAVRLKKCSKKPQRTYSAKYTHPEQRAHSSVSSLPPQRAAPVARARSGDGDGSVPTTAPTSDPGLPVPSSATPYAVPVGNTRTGVVDEAGSEEGTTAPIWELTGHVRGSIGLTPPPNFSPTIYPEGAQAFSAYLKIVLVSEIRLALFSQRTLQLLFNALIDTSKTLKSQQICETGSFP